MPRSDSGGESREQPPGSLISASRSWSSIASMNVSKRNKKTLWRLDWKMMKDIDAP